MKMRQEALISTRLLVKTSLGEAHSDEIVYLLVLVLESVQK